MFKAFFSKWMKSEKPVSEDLSDNPLEKRLHPRYSVKSFASATVVFDNKIKGKIIDISYSGIAIEFTDPNDIKKIANSCTIEIFFLGRNTTVDAYLVYVGKTSCGFCFAHRDAMALVYLRDILESFRCASTLMKLGKDVVHDRYRSDDWLVLRGDGPTHLTIKLKSPQNSAPMDSALLTYLDGEQYRHLRYNNGEIFTGTSIDFDGGVATRMQEQALPDLEVARHGIYVMYAIPSRDVREKIEPFLKKAIEVVLKSIK